jgi:hypothetical protein
MGAGIVNAIRCPVAQGLGFRRFSSKSSLVSGQSWQSKSSTGRRSASSVTFANLISSTPASSSPASSSEQLSVADVEPASWTLRKGKMVRENSSFQDFLAQQGPSPALLNSV